MKFQGTDRYIATDDLMLAVSEDRNGVVMVKRYRLSITE